MWILGGIPAMGQVRPRPNEPCVPRMSENTAPPTPPIARHFDAAYRERVSLLDGSAAILRLVRPSDKDALRRGVERLSPRSRYLRFFNSKRKLSERELAYLTQTDNVSHLAIGAVTEGPDGVEEGLGIARFVRSASEPDQAEAAVAVIDDWQGKGLGTVLLLRLIAAARERGILYFTAQVQRTNLAMRSLLDAVPAAMIQPLGHETLQMSIRLPEVSVVAHVLPAASELGQVFRMSRERAIVVEPAPLWPG
jgi:GNAT superfamily N-acetyltransferase